MYAHVLEHSRMRLADLPDLIGKPILIRYRTGLILEGTLLEVDLAKDIIVLEYSHDKLNSSTVLRRTHHKLYRKLDQGKITEIIRLGYRRSIYCNL